MEVKGARPDEYSVILFGPAGQRVWANLREHRRSVDRVRAAYFDPRRIAAIKAVDARVALFCSVAFAMSSRLPLSPAVISRSMAISSVSHFVRGEPVREPAHCESSSVGRRLRS